MAASDGVRIVDFSVTGGRADLVPENFIALDSELGTKKIPANLVKGDLVVFNVPFNTQQSAYVWPDWDKVQDAINSGCYVVLKVNGTGTFDYYASTGRSFEINDQDQTLSVYEFVDVTTGDSYVVKYNNDTETWGSPVGRDKFVPGSLASGGSLTDAASISIANNRLYTLTTAQTSLTLNVTLAGGEVPNFAVEITAGAAVTLTVTKTVGSTTTTLKQSVAGGNELESGKFYQLTCVGSCWTVAEFEQPSQS